MFIQSVVDNQFSATYVEDYFDSVENLPEDVQRHISHAHELDIAYRSFLKEVTELKELIENGKLDANAERKILKKLDQALISLQEIGDEKVEISQQIVDLADSKYRQLDQDFRNLDFSKEQENGEQSYHGKESSRESVRESSSREERGNTGVNGESGGGRGTKRARRSRVDTETSDVPPPPDPPPPPPPPPRQAKRQTSRKKKRKSTRTNQTKESPEEELQPEIDEPTYCLCDQISYGEMILCDNDLCPIQWFHFTCVELSSKPKGKWFCPKCRGDRPNVMKPKSQFLKELEKYNKEKEEKG